MFEVKKHAIGKFDAYRLINKTTGEYLEVLADIGAGLNDLMVKNNAGELKSMIAGYRSEKEIKNTIHSSFKGSKLSPFPNRLYGGKYSFEGDEYQMIINDVGGNTNLHALLHNRKFECVDTASSEGRAELTLKHDYLGIEQGYPFSYSISVTYSMIVGQVEIKTCIENTDDVNLPIGDGWHPYFKFDNVDNVALKMGGAERISSLKGNELSKVHGFENVNEIGNLSLDDCFEISKDQEKFTISLEDAQSGVRLSLSQASKKGQYRYLQLYTPDDRKSIAVEPVTCPPDAFNTKKDLVILSPGQKIELGVILNYSTI